MKLKERYLRLRTRLPWVAKRLTAPFGYVLVTEINDTVPLTIGFDAPIADAKRELGGVRVTLVTGKTLFVTDANIAAAKKQAKRQIRAIIEGLKKAQAKTA